uniref:Uncharacterized protein n=1 Tax=viral metagenome TaxID=1070528 RepID=A0A6M3LYL5_9ZZZZ
MNGKKAKQIRKDVYGDDSLRGERRYVKLADGSLRVIGKRRGYQSAKRSQGIDNGKR